MVNTAATTYNTLQVKAADFILGVSSMGNDLKTLSDSSKSAGDKIWAGVDLAFNAGSDIALVTGIGEAIRGGELVVRGTEMVGEAITKEVAAHEEENLVEHAAAECGGGLSFTFSTKVATAQGAQAIGSLMPDEQVWAYNPQTKKMELKPIEHVWINHDDDLIDLTLTIPEHQKQGKRIEQTSEVIHTNKKHPFLTEEEGFVSVGELMPGMHIMRADGSVGVVSRWVMVPGSGTMYNLEVQQDHTFTVGDGHWVVHNSGNCFDRGITKLEELDESVTKGLTHNPDLIDAGRSGGNRPFNGPPNSYSHTTGGHALVYDQNGELIYDIDPSRIKMVKFDVAPNGRVFPRDFKLYDANGKLGVPPAWQSLLP